MTARLNVRTFSGTIYVTRNTTSTFLYKDELIELKTLGNEICTGRTRSWCQKAVKLPVVVVLSDLDLEEIASQAVLHRIEMIFATEILHIFSRNSLIPCFSDCPASRLFASTLQLCALDEELASSLSSKDASPEKRLWLRMHLGSSNPNKMVAYAMFETCHESGLLSLVLFALPSPPIRENINSESTRNLA